MTDPDAHPAFRARAERGSHRDPGAIFDAALTESTTPAANHGHPERPGAGRSRTRYAAAAGLLVALGIGGAVWIASDDDPVEHLTADGSTLCRTMAEPVIGDDHDAVVYLEPETTAEDARRLGDALSRLPGLVGLVHVGQEKTWARFQELFRGDDAMLGNVRPVDLPTSFELTFESFDAAAEAALLAEVRAHDDILDHPQIRTASDARVLDVIGLAGRIAAEYGAAHTDRAIGPMVARRLAELAASDRTLDPQVRTDLVMLQQVLAGRLQRRLSDAQAGDVVASVNRLTELAVTSCGLPFDETFGIGVATSDSGVATLPSTGSGMTSEPTTVPLDGD